MSNSSFKLNDLVFLSYPVTHTHIHTHTHTHEYSIAAVDQPHFSKRIIGDEDYMHLLLQLTPRMKTSLT